MSEIKAVFDRSRQFAIQIISGGEKPCLVSFPSDSQWCDYARKQRNVRHILGRGKTQAEKLDLRPLALELFQNIRADKDGAVFTGGEALAVIGRLETAEVQDVQREGNQYRITLKVMGGKVEHVLRMPNQDEIHDHEQASTSIISGKRSYEIRARLEPSGELYDKLHVSHEGYHGPVPVIHKAAAVSEVLEQISQVLDGDGDPE